MRKSILIVVSFAAMAAPALAQRADLSRLVVVGDSLSAGFQNFSLFDTNGAPAPGGEQHGYAAVVAQQANVSLTERLISFPGFPPTLELTPGGVVRASGVGGPENPGVQVTNLSVPGFTVADALAHAFPGDVVTPNAIDLMSDWILAAPGNTAFGCGPLPSSLLPFPPSPPSIYAVSEAICATGLRPTTILLSIGSNDALQALTFGVPPTNPGVFAAQYGVMLAILASTHAKIVVNNIPDVTLVPFLVPVPAFHAACGFTPTGATNADFVVPNIVNPTGNSFNICMNYAVRPAALIATTKASVAFYNEIIAAEARAVGAVVVDVNSLITNLAKNGIVVNGELLTTQYLGGLFSLDALHPTNTGYAILANAVIKTMNQDLDTSIPPVSVGQVATTDPLVPPKH